MHRRREATASSRGATGACRAHGCCGGGHHRGRHGAPAIVVGRENVTSASDARRTVPPSSYENSGVGEYETENTRTERFGEGWLLVVRIGDEDSTVAAEIAGQSGLDLATRCRIRRSGDVELSVGIGSASGSPGCGVHCISMEGLRAYETSVVLVRVFLSCILVSSELLNTI